MEGGRGGGKDLFTHPLLLRIDTAIEQLLQKRQSKPKKEKGIAGGREGGRDGGRAVLPTPSSYVSVEQ